MATYKLIQDIEAEDHIIGNLSLRQFIYGMVASFLYYICYFLYSKGAGFMLIFLLPPALFFTFFAFPFGKDQSTEVWALAKVRYFLKPRKRIWNQSGLRELVTITVPKTIERVLTDGLSQGEVKSRLNALANTLDSRGWAVKNVNANTYSYNDPFMPKSSDRLVDISSAPREVPNDVIMASEDILDEYSSPVAQQFEQMITQSEKAHRQQIINRMNSLTQTPEPQKSAPADYWFMSQPPSSSLAPNQAMFPGNQIVQPGSPTAQVTETAEEIAVVEKLRAQNNDRHVANNHLRTLQPLSSAPQPQQSIPQAPAPTPVTPQAAPDIIRTLASNNDLDIATLARQAGKANLDNEVVISLH